jgi:two-component system nitrogen regulation response regulator NtrX
MSKILVIDDERSIRHLLDAYLRRKGYDVVLAENGQSGLELIRHEQPDVIVLDLNMPEMNGLTVLRHIRSLNHDQPVIMFSGAWTPDREHQARALGVAELVQKDLSLDRLNDALKRTLKTLEPASCTRAEDVQK